MHTFIPCQPIFKMILRRRRSLKQIIGILAIVGIMGCTFYMQKGQSGKSLIHEIIHRDKLEADIVHRNHIEPNIVPIEQQDPDIVHRHPLEPDIVSIDALEADIVAMDHLKPDVVHMDHLEHNNQDDLHEIDKENEDVDRAENVKDHDDEGLDRGNKGDGLYENIHHEDNGVRDHIIDKKYDNKHDLDDNVDNNDDGKNNNDDKFRQEVDNEINVHKNGVTGEKDDEEKDGEESEETEEEVMQIRVPVAKDEPGSVKL